MKRLLLIPFIVLPCLVTKAQTTFQKAYGGSGISICRHVEQTTDGGYILVGSTNSYGAGGYDVYLVKTNFSGDTLWTRTFGGSADDDGYCVKQTTDGGYILCGNTQSFGLQGAYVIKTNSAGDTLWTRVYGYTFSIGYSVSLTSDGGYVVGGTTIRFNGTRDMNLIKLDASGNFQWNKTYGGNGNEFAGNAVQTSDGGYLMFGTKRYLALDDRFFVIRTNSVGDTTGNKLYDYFGIAADCWYGIQTSDGGIAMAGNVSGNGSLMFIKADNNFLNPVMTTLDGTGSESARSVFQTNDGGFLLCGYTNSIGMGDSDVYVAKLNSSGNVVWSALYGGVNADVGYSARQTSDGGYIIAGSTGSFTAKKMYLVKTDSLGSSGCNQDLFDTLSAVNSPAPTSTSNIWYPLSSDSSYSTATAIHTGAAVGNLCLQLGCSAAISASTNISCYNSCDGGATVSFSGGSGPYTYQWIPVGGNAPSATGLCAGNYTVIVSDAVGCSASATVVITEPTAVFANISSSHNLTCFGGSDGWATVNAFGGTGAYSYTWVPSGGNNATANNLSAGTYTVSVTDMNGCMTAATVVLTEPTLLTSAIINSSDASCSTCNDGSAVVNANGGTLPYTYTWFPSGGNSATASNLTPGNYTVCVTDAHGCSTCTGVMINYPTGLNEIQQQEMFSIYPNPAHNGFTISFNKESGIQNRELKIYDVMGRAVQEEKIHSQLSTVNCQLSAGIYLLKITAEDKIYQQKLFIE
jgi:hypothetical protein